MGCGRINIYTSTGVRAPTRTEARLLDANEEIRKLRAAIVARKDLESRTLPPI